jgi:hypothetical protein
MTLQNNAAAHLAIYITWVSHNRPWRHINLQPVRVLCPLQRQAGTSSSKGGLVLGDDGLHLQGGESTCSQHTIATLTAHKHYPCNNPLQNKHGDVPKQQVQPPNSLGFPTTAVATAAHTCCSHTL